MNKTMKYFCMAALAMVGAVMTSCSSDDSMTDTLQQPASNVVDKVETLTVSVSLNGDGATRALTAEGVKTFAEGDQIAVVYTNTNNETVKAVSDPLKEADIESDGTARFTVTVTDANKAEDVTYIYPAAMAKDDGSANYEALANQDGTLATIAKELDYSYFNGKWKEDGHLPSGELDNQLAICAFTLKDAQGDINSTVNSMTINVGTNTYTINRTVASDNPIYDPIYVAIKPVSSSEISYTATAGAKSYLKLVKFSPSKEYKAGSLYTIGLKMAEVVKGKFSVSGSKKVYFSPGNLQATYNGSAWNWHFAANQWDKVGAEVANNSINGNGTVSTIGTVDLFTWSTAETALGISVETNDNISNTFVDWGSASAVKAAIGTGYRTLSSAEWYYLFSSSRSDNRYCYAKVHDVYGVILLPDDWNTDTYNLENYNPDFNTPISFNDTNVNVVEDDDWDNKLAPNGVVFLPAAGQRNGTSTINGDGKQLHYWSATPTGTTNLKAANHLRIMGDGSTNAAVVPSTGGGKQNGFSVRLVYDVE